MQSILTWQWDKAYVSKSQPSLTGSIFKDSRLHVVGVWHRDRYCSRWTTKIEIKKLEIKPCLAHSWYCIHMIISRFYRTGKRNPSIRLSTYRWHVGKDAEIPIRFSLLGKTNMMPFYRFANWLARYYSEQNFVIVILVTAFGIFWLRETNRNLERAI